MIKNNYVNVVKCRVTYLKRSKYSKNLEIGVFNLRLLDLDYFLKLDCVEIHDFKIYQVNCEYITKDHRKI